MTSLVKHSEVEIVSFIAICAAIVSTVFTTYLCLARILRYDHGHMGLIFHGVIEAFQSYGLIAGH